jgi:hypothetical protein
MIVRRHRRGGALGLAGGPVHRVLRCADPDGARRGMAARRRRGSCKQKRLLLLPLLLLLLLQLGLLQ